MAGARTPEDTNALADRVDEVTAHLVGLRGGAPFLSGPDGRLLVGWLEGGVPVAVLVGAMERVALRRRRGGKGGRTAKSRFTLAACRREVQKALGAGDEAVLVPKPLKTGGFGGLTALAGSIAAMEVPPELSPARASAARAIDEAACATDPDEAARHAIAACRAFHAAAWEQADRSALLRDAESRLSRLREAVTSETFAALVEEEARAALRARWPLLSGTSVCDSLDRTP